MPIDCEGAEPSRMVAMEHPAAGLRDDRGWVVNGDGHVWAIECGAAPRRAFDGDTFREPLQAGLPWFGLRIEPLQPDGLDEYFPLDPWGDSEPQRIPGPVLGVSGDAIVVLDLDHAREAIDPRFVHVPTHPKTSSVQPVALQLLHEPADAWPDHHLSNIRSTLSGMLIPSQIPETRSALATLWLPDDPREHGVAEIDLETGAVRLVRGGARIDRRIQPGGRFALLEDDDDADAVQHLVFDRSTGSEIRLGRVGWSSVGIDTATAAARGEEETHLVLLPELRELWLAGSWQTDSQMVGDDGRRVLIGPDGTYVLSPGDDVPKRIAEVRGMTRVVGDHAYVIDYEHTDDDFARDWRDPFRILRIPLDGGETEDVLGNPVFAVLPLTRGRWAVIRDADGTGWEDLRGSLLVVDPQSGSETLLADDVTTIPLHTLNGRVGDPEDLRRTLAVDAPYEDFLFARWTDDDRDDINGVWWAAP